MGSNPFPIHVNIQGGFCYIHSTDSDCFLNVDTFLAIVQDADDAVGKFDRDAFRFRLVCFAVFPTVIDFCGISFVSIFL